MKEQGHALPRAKKNVPFASAKGTLLAYRRLLDDNFGGVLESVAVKDPHDVDS